MHKEHIQAHEDIAINISGEALQNVVLIKAQNEPRRDQETICNYHSDDFLFQGALVPNVIILLTEAGESPGRTENSA